MGAIAFVAFLDYFIPVNVQVVLLYLIPLCYVALHVQMRFGFLACIWGAGCWWLSSLLATGGNPFDGIRLWNTFSRGTIFFTFVSLIHYFNAQIREKEQTMAFLRKTKMEHNPAMGLRRICNHCGNVQSSSGDWLSIKSWLARDCLVTWADSQCSSCSTKPENRDEQ